MKKAFWFASELYLWVFSASMMDLSCRACVGSRWRFESPKKLLTHYEKFHSKLTIRCDVCYNFFSDESALKGHMIEDHWDDEPYRCEHCDQGFANLEGIWSHSTSKHKDMKEICGLCGNACDSIGQHTIECNKKK